MVRSSLALVLVGLVVAGPAVAARAQTAPTTDENPVPSWNECVQNVAFPGPSGEIYGPTAINAQSANGRLAAAVDDHGTLTVLRWPHPSFYDQIKYRTSDRDAPRYGALPNEGAFLGLHVTTADGGQRTVWLRDLPADQRYPDDRSDLVTTTYRADELGLTVTVADLVPLDVDALVRHVTVERDTSSPVTAAAVVAFENLNLVASKWPYGPVQDWCFEELNTDTARYDAPSDAIVHTKQAVDASTGTQTSVAVGLAFARSSDQHQVGGDAYEGTASPAGRLPGSTQDAYDDAGDGQLHGGTAYEGQTTGALLRTLDWQGRRADATVVLAAASDQAGVTSVLDRLRGVPMARLAAAKRAWFDRLLRDAPMPGTDDPDILALAHRALVTLASVYDPATGAIAASIATQSPYGEDWIRDGAFFNHVLDLIGRHDWADTRVRWYASLQSRPGAQPGADNPLAGRWGTALVPPGNWAMNYYADGVVGGPIPWEIDETGYGLWAFWDHYLATGDTDTLTAVYPAITRAADFLTECTDPTSGLPCPAIEDDNPQPSQTIHGAGPVWLGLHSAVQAARALGHDADAERWQARAAELRDAIEANLYADGSYGNGNGVIVWPVCFHPLDDPRFADGQYAAIWDRIGPTFDEPAAGARTRGLYESKGLIALAKAARDRQPWRDRLERGLHWIATQHAQPGTHIMGEEWLVENGEVVSTVSQPHVWEQVLFYLAALETYPPAGVTPRPGCGGVAAAIRGESAGRAAPVTARPGTTSQGSAGDARPTTPADATARLLPATGGGARTTLAGALLTLGGLGVASRARRRRRMTGRRTIEGTDVPSGGCRHHSGGVAPMDRALARRIVGTAFVVLLVAGVRLLFQFSHRVPGAYTIDIVLGRAGAGMTNGNDVKVRGVVVGHVADVRFEDGEAVVTAKLDPEPRLPDDVRPVVTAKTLLGEKQIELRTSGPLAPPYLQAGARLRVADDKQPTEVGAVVAALADTLGKIDPGRLATVIDAFGSFGREDAATVQKNIEEGRKLAAFGARTATAQLDRMSALADVFGTLAGVTDDLARLDRTIPTWVSVLPDRQADVRATLDTLGSFALGFAEYLETDKGLIDALFVTGDEVGAALDPRMDEIGRMIYGIYRYSLVFGQHGGSLDDGTEFAFFRAFLGDEGSIKEICDGLPPQFRTVAPGCVSDTGGAGGGS